ncbi:MAG: hypothetical protein WD081_06395 [Gammaproteobacteria bacterium]
MNRLTAVVFVALLASGTAIAQDAPRCAAPEYRAFDFWLGDWTVRTADGTVAGRNEIQAMAGGCGLLEHWRGVRGGEGMSLNAFDPVLGRWTQRWVGAGVVLWLEGGLVDGAMVMVGPTPRQTPQGAFLDRITWTPLDDGRVRQFWEVSSDGGATWQPYFDGYYSRTAATGGGSDGSGLKPRSFDF